VTSLMPYAKNNVHGAGDGPFMSGWSRWMMQTRQGIGGFLLLLLVIARQSCPVDVSSEYPSGFRLRNKGSCDSQGRPIARAYGGRS
jgi:hypothetical protein